MTTKFMARNRGKRDSPGRVERFHWGRGGGASASLLLQDLVELVGVVGGLDPDQEGDGAAGVLVVDGRVGDAHHHDVVLPEPRAGHGRRQDDVEQDVS